MKNGVLYWFTKEQPPSSDFRKFIKGSINIDGCKCASVSISSILMSTSTKSYTLICASKQERDSWVDAIKYQMNSVRKDVNEVNKK